jgi:2-phospho-L-lactate/phosphoenolpyruvate guanylyltransferase
MNLHAIVPVKALGQAKSRLAVVLTPAERRRLVIDMFEQVLATLRRACVSAVWVVSADPEILAIAAARRANAVAEQGGGLNAALEQARRAARGGGAEALVVVPADVPLLTPADVAALLALLHSGADVALAPDGAGRGTNALALRASAALPFSFGEGSAERHLRLAAEQGLIARRHHSPTLALDVDDQPSLARYRALALPPSRQALEQPCC